MNITGYKIEKLIGKGGMAMVYMATQESLGRPVALKVMNPLYSDSPEFSKRFLNEGRILASLNHSNIITIHDIGISNNFHFISMEYVDGGDLKQRIRLGLVPAEAVRYIEIIASCLSRAHKAHIVHRDIKPVNILFRKDGTLLLTDFGIAKQLTASSDLTATGCMIGSPHYLSPEQAKGKPVDGRADIYSLGIIYYEMLTGKRPFTGESDLDIAGKHLKEPLPRLPESLAPHQTIIDKMTQKAPKDRFPNADSLIQALRELREHGEWSGNIAPGCKPDSMEQTSFGAPSIQETTPPPLEEEGASATTTIKAPIPSPPKKVASSRPSFLGAGIIILLLVIGFLLLPIGEQQTEPTSPPPSSAAGKTQPPSAEGGGPTSAPTKEQPAPSTASKKTKRPRVDPAKAEAARKAAEAKKREQARQAKIGQLLEKAEKAFTGYHLTTPKETSAHTYYRKVMELDPGNPRAEKGIKEIADRYHEMALKAEEKWDYENANRYIKLGLSVMADHPRLLNLEQKLKGEKGKTERSIKDGLKGLKKFFDELPKPDPNVTPSDDNYDY